MAKKLICQRCGNVWNYKGKSEFVTSCSRCKTSVMINKRDGS